MARESMVFYRSFFDALRGLPADQFKECVMALLEYGLDGKAPEGNGISNTVFIMAKPQIDANNVRYENGCKGGRKPNANQTETKPKPNRNQTETKNKPNGNQSETEPKPNVNDNVNVNVNDNVNVNVNVNDNEGVIAPTRDEVRQYCLEKGLAGIKLADKFFDHYQAQHWRTTTGAIIYDWQAKIRNWVKQDNPDRPLMLYGG